MHVWEQNVLVQSAKVFPQSQESLSWELDMLAVRPLALPAFEMKEHTFSSRKLLALRNKPVRTRTVVAMIH